jgi:putative transposase
VGEGGDEVSVAGFIADQRTSYRVPHAVCCAILGVSVSWFYKWLARIGDPAPTVRAQRRALLDAEVRRLFEASGATYGSPRIHLDLAEAGWAVSVNTVADSMRRQGLFGRKPKRYRGLTRQDKAAPKFPDLLARDFTAPAPNLKWCGDMTEIPTDEGKLYLAHVIDLCSRRLLAAAMSEHPDAVLAADAIKDRRRRARGPVGDRGCHLPHRPRLDLHCEGFPAPVRRAARDPPVDGPGRIVFR